MDNFNKIVLDDETLEVEDTKARTDIGDVSSLQTTTKENIVKAVNECFQSASNGKKAVANAITGAGVSTSESATFATMATNIGTVATNKYNAGVAYADGRANPSSTNYTTGYNAGVSATKVGTATAAQVLSGATFTNASTVGSTGTMANNGAVSQSLNAGGSYTIPEGYHNGSGKVSANSLASQTAGTATAAQILSGQTAWVGGSKLTGTMVNKSGTTEYTATAALDSTNSELEMTVPATGYYTSNNKLKATFATIASLIGLTSAKLARGNTVLGITGNSNVVDTSTGTATAAQILSGYSAYVKGVKVNGTATSGKKYASGTSYTLGTHPNASMIYYRAFQEPDVYSRNGYSSTIAIDPGFAASILKAQYVRVSGITAYYYTVVLRYDGTSFHFDCIDDANNSSQNLGYSCYFQNYVSPRVGNTFYLPHSHLIDVIYGVSWEAWE